MRDVLLRSGLPLYDLEEASRRLLQGPGWLRRRAGQGAIPHVLVPAPDGTAARWAFPQAWVDAATGDRPADPDAVAAHWRERLAPPPAEAHRATRDRAELPWGVEDLVDVARVERRLLLAPAARRRLEADGRLPVLQVDGALGYDRTLIDLLAEAAEGPSLTPGDLEGRIARRRAEVEPFTRFAYRSAAATAPPADGAAWTVPDDLDLASIEPLPPPRPRIVEADGFEVVEDD